MKLVAKTDVEAGAEALFPLLADAPWFERLASRNGARVERTDSRPGIGVGSAWRVRFPYRGRERTVISAIDRIEAPKRLAISGQSGGIDFSIEAALAPLSRQTTRLAVALDLRPRSFAARVLLQTLRLGKGRLEARLQHRLQALAQVLKDRAAQR